MTAATVTGPARRAITTDALLAVTAAVAVLLWAKWLRYAPGR